METKKITLPNGMEVTFRQIGILDYKAAYGTLPLALTNGNSDTPIKTYNEAIDPGLKLVCLACLAPKFAVEPGEGEMSINVLTPRNFAALREAIEDYSGMREAQEQVRPS